MLLRNKRLNDAWPKDTHASGNVWMIHKKSCYLSYIIIKFTLIFRLLHSSHTWAASPNNIDSSCSNVNGFHIWKSCPNLFPSPLVMSAPMFCLFSLMMLWLLSGTMKDFPLTTCPLRMQQSWPIPSSGHSWLILSCRVSSGSRTGIYSLSSSRVKHRGLTCYKWRKIGPTTSFNIYFLWNNLLYFLFWEPFLLFVNLVLC